MKTIAVLPIKRLSNSKQRLADELPSSSRIALMRAMITDMVIGLRRAKLVDETIVVTGDEIAEQIAVNFGAQVVDDDHDDGHSEASLIGIEAAISRGAQRVLLVASDCPAVIPGEIDQLLSLSGESAKEVIIVPDRHGEGTNALVLSPPTVIEPAFGSPSKDRHAAAARAAGATVLIAEPPTLLLDVDTVDDLQALRDRLSEIRGGASHTRGILPRLFDL